MSISSFGDSFQEYASAADLLINWTSYDTSTPLVWGNTLGRQGNGGIQTSAVNGTGLTKAIALPVSSSVPLQFGFNIKCTTPGLMFGRQNGIQISMNSSAYIWNILGGSNSVTTALTLQNDIQGAHGTTTGLAPVSDGNWHFVEMEALLNTSAGHVKVWVDGVLDINYSGPTCSSLPSTIDGFTINPSEMGGPNNQNVQLSDFYFDATGNLTLPYGPMYAQTYVPTSNGDTIQFTPSAGSNYSNVNTGFHGSNYNSDASTGHEDIFHCGTISDSPALLPFVITSTYGENPGSGTANYIPKVKTGSTTANGATSTWPILSLQNIQQTFYNDATGTPWTKASFNSSQFGYGD